MQNNAGIKFDKPIYYVMSKFAEIMPCKIIRKLTYSSNTCAVS